MSQYEVSGSNFYEKDGDRSHQASITTDMLALPVPNRISVTSSDDLYPAVPAQAPSTILRGDLAVIDVDHQLMVTSSGPSASGCFASFGNRDKPQKNKEDEFCKGYRVVGVIKNTETDPGGAMFGPNGGIPRINSTQVAVQVAGAITLKYNHPNKAAIMGDLLIWYPPDYNRNYRRDERPVPIIGPLHWSLFLDSIKNVCVAMLQMQKNGNLQLLSPMEGSSDRSGGPSHNIWRNVASERKRAILVHIMSALFVLVKRGYLMVLTPKISKEMALKDRLVAEVLKAVAQIGAPGGTPDITNLVKTAEKNYREALSGKGSMDASNNKSSQEYFRYNPSLKRAGLGVMDKIEIIQRDGSNYLQTYLNVGGGDTQQKTMNKDALQQESLVWMVENLGLAGGKSGCGTGDNREPIHPVIYDILRLSSASASGDSVALGFLKSRAGLLGVEENTSVNAFIAHLKNYLAGEEIAHMELRDMFTNRGVGYALSSAAGLGNSMTNSKMVPTIDVVVGGRRW